MAKLSITKAANALRANDGIILKAAEACGVHRHTFRKFMDEHPELEEIRNEVDEAILDVGDSHIINAVKAGDLKTIRWYQERKGKDRGYTTRQETTGKDGEPLNVGVIERRIVDPEENEE
jgi:hypothetical protein